MKKRVTVTAVAEYDEENFDNFSDGQVEEMLLDSVQMGDYPLEPTTEVVEE